MRASFIFVILLVLLMALVFSGCAQVNQEVNTPGTDGVAGFWPGLWQGFILPVAFIVSLFSDDVGIYEIHNNGNWYNFGFVLGIGIGYSIFGGGGAKASRRCK